MKNRKKGLAFLHLINILLLIGCSKNEKDDSYKVLNDIFLTAVDTQGYYGSIRPVPSYKDGNLQMLDSQIVKQPYLFFENYPIDTINVWSKSIENQLLDSGYKKKDIINFKSPDNYKWKIKGIQKCGRYILIDSLNSNDSIKLVGHVWASKIIFHPDGNKAFLLFKKGIGGKKGDLIMMIWLSKNNGEWKIISIEPFYYT